MVARDPQYYSFLKKSLTEEFVASKFDHFLELSEGQNKKSDLVKRLV